MKPAARAADILVRLRRFLTAQNAAGKRMTVGFSGGLDSMVLLDCLSRLRETIPLQLGAVHVNHGLSPNADHWARFCAEQARARAIPIDVLKVQVRRTRGASIEAQAREARFAAFSQLDTDYLVLAHHLDDQGETLLLQLLRGAGPKGLASMAPSRMHAGKIHVLRPLLDISRTKIQSYAEAGALQWIDDESNQDLRFDRNFLRARVLPILAQRFPGYRENLARSAKNMQDLDEVAGTLGRQDLLNLTRGRGIAVAGLRELSETRAMNALRTALQARDVAMPARDRLRELLRQACGARRDGKVRVELGRLTGQVYRGDLFFTRTRAEPQPWSLQWNGENPVQLPYAQGWIHVTRTKGRGLRARALEKLLHFANRGGGEKLQLHPRQPRKTLTHLYQTAAVPPWERARMPLLFSDKDVLWVPALGYAASEQASAEQDGIELTWIETEDEQNNL